MEPTCKRLVFAALMICSLTSWSQSQDEKKQVEQIVIDFFAGFSNNAKEQVDVLLTDDFTILEHGIVWNIDSVHQYMSKAKFKDFSRTIVSNFEKRKFMALQP